MASPRFDRTPDDAAPPAADRPGPAVRLARVRRLLWRHRVDLVRAVALLPLVALGLRRSGHAAVAARLAARRPPVPAVTEPGTDQVGVGSELAFVVRQAARLVPDASCLRKALVLHHLLARRGVPAVVRIGVRTGAEPGDLAFHAWVEVASVVVSEPASEVAGFVVLSDDGAPPHPDRPVLPEPPTTG